MHLFTLVRAGVVVLAGPSSWAPVPPRRRRRTRIAPDPNTGLGLGDQLIFHDLLFVKGVQVGDEGGSCVILDAGQTLANCVHTIRLAGGTITAQFLNSPPPLKQLAITGGSGSYRRVAGDGTLLEHGDGTGTETLHLFGVRD